MSILLLGAAGMILMALVLAWIATFAKLIPVERVRAAVKDYHSLIRAHIDLLLMALFCLSINNLRLELPTFISCAFVLGGFTNPSLFLLRAFYPDAGAARITKVYRACSFAITSAGFVSIAVMVVLREVSK